MPAELPLMLLGLATGFVFGFLLQKSGVARFETIIGQFVFRDFTMLKVMLTAIIVGGVGVYGIHEFGGKDLVIKQAQMDAVLLGGLIFGAGMALLGYCPGTAVASAAQGNRDALAGLLGMFAGGAMFAENFSYYAATLLKRHDLGKPTLPDLTGLPAWLFFAALIAVALPLFAWLERRERS